MQRIVALPVFDTSSLIYVIEYLLIVRARGFYPEALDSYMTTEHKMAVSPDDLMKNIIEVKRAKRAKHLAQMGYPFHRNVDVQELVSDLK